MPASKQAEPQPAPRAKLLGAGTVAATRAGRTVWALARQHPRIAMVIGVSVPVLFAPLFALWLRRPPAPKPKVQEKQVTLAAAFAELDRGRHAAAAKLAKELAEAGPAEGEAADLAFLLGATASQQAEGLDAENQSRYSLLAARHLMESRDAGFPKDREAQGLLLLGKNLFRSGQLEASREVLQEALPLNREQAAQIHRMLGELCLIDAPPQLDSALDHNTTYLAAQSLSNEERQAAHLQRAAVLLRLARCDEGRQALEQIPAASPLHLDARILSARLQVSEGQHEAALDELDSIRKSLSADDPRYATVAYLSGICCQALENASQAQAHFAKVRSLYPDTLEAITARACEADLLRKEQRHSEAVDLYRQLLAALSQNRHRQDWVTLDELRQRVLGAYQDYVNAGQHESAAAIAKSLGPLLNPAARLELSATAHRTWGEAVMAEAERNADDKGRTLRQQAEDALRQAGRDLQNLAQARFATREFPNDLWASAECFLLAHDYAMAQRMLEKYLEHEPSRRSSQALVRLGEAQLLQGRPEQALQSLNEALQSPLDVAVYRGRVLAAQAHLELNDVETAEKLLRDNLDSEQLAPASVEWRESLFALGRLLHLTDRYVESLQRLSDAVRRYPRDPDALNARYLIGESYRQLAREAIVQRDAALVESARNAHAREAYRLLDSAIAAYDEAARSIEARSEITRPESVLLRNCRYMKAAALFDTGRYEDAIKAYSTAINQYQQSPEVLDAYVRIADCFRRLRRPLDARGTIEQAKVVLNRLPEDAQFTQTTNFDRKEWKSYLDWLGAL